MFFSSVFFADRSVKAFDEEKVNTTESTTASSTHSARDFSVRRTRREANEEDECGY